MFGSFLVNLLLARKYISLTVLHCTVLHCTVLYCTVLYFFIFLRNDKLYNVHHVVLVNFWEVVIIYSWDENNCNNIHNDFKAGDVMTHGQQASTTLCNIIMQHILLLLLLLLRYQVEL